MSFVPLLAHIGHWYMWLLYAVPVLVVIAASLHALIDQHREDRERDVEEARGS
jgi:heme exporter protein D